MFIKSFLKLVEIQTKVASVVPFFLGSTFALYNYHNFNFKNFLIMFISLLSFDMVATAINNYIDYKKAIKKHGYNYEFHNAIVRDGLKESTVIIIIILLFSIASLSGIFLFLNTNIVVLILGIISFLVGIFYSFGPVPISRTPFGEIFSGFFMGFIIILLSIYIHVHNSGLIDLTFIDGIINLKLNFFQIIALFFVSLPAVNGISNIMLANNICDIEDDIKNKRYTLPIYMGKNVSLKLFKIVYYIIYVDIIVLVLFDVLPFSSLLVLLTIKFVQNNINDFYKKQSKKETFIVSIKNFLVINISYIISLLIAIAFKIL